MLSAGKNLQGVAGNGQKQRAPASKSKPRQAMASNGKRQQQSILNPRLHRFEPRLLQRPWAADATMKSL
eukprot:4205313-Alexandrium_andersonii.AAC.1